MTKLYGNLNNRLDEGKIFGANEIKEGMDVTMYFYSDRHTYFVTKVNNQKNIFVKQYKVCADFETAGGMGHQNWKQFKTTKEYVDYLVKHGREQADAIYHETTEQEWVYRFNKWQVVERWTLEKYNALEQSAKWFMNLTATEIAKLQAGGVVVKYRNLSGKVSFNVNDYHHDWEF